MKYYIHIDNNGNVLGRYVDGIHTDIPTPNLEVSEEVWNETMQNNSNYYNSETETFEAKYILSNDDKVALYKSYYLERFNAKLDELDYDDISTVGVWAIKTGSTFQAEAKALLNWYEAIISKNYEILNAIKKGDREMPSREEYLAELPLYTTYKI